MALITFVKWVICDDIAESGVLWVLAGSSHPWTVQQHGRSVGFFSAAYSMFKMQVLLNYIWNLASTRLFISKPFWSNLFSICDIPSCQMHWLSRDPITLTNEQRYITPHAAWPSQQPSICCPMWSQPILSIIYSIISHDCAFYLPEAKLGSNELQSKGQ